MLRKVGEVAVVSLIVINGLELAFFLAMRHAGGLYAARQQFPLPSGYSLGGRHVPPEVAPCYLIRVSAKGCEYCRLDRREFTLLARQAQERRCETIIVAPVAAQTDSYSDSRIVQLQYVDMEFGRALNPFVTPQTILLDHSSRAIWYQAGAMDDHSLSGAIRGLGKLH